MDSQKYNNRKIYSLRDVSESICNVIAQNYTKDFYVVAEISKLNYYPHSGHCYPDLVERHNNIIQAQIRSIIWSKDYERITQKFKEITGNHLTDGLKILCLATLSYHPNHGLSLTIKDIIPEFSLGETVKEKEKTIKRLKDEHLFDLNKQKDLPLFPKRMAIISVSTSKGYHDYMQMMKPYEEKYHLLQPLFPALLQGDGAVSSIMKQLDIIRTYSTFFDLVLILRGGGGDIGLNCYDHYDLAKSVASFPIPVITGIGHATNQTVVDMVAKHSGITPTDTAHFIIQIIDQYIYQLNEYESLIKQISKKNIALAYKQCDDISTKINLLSHQIIKQQKEKLVGMEEKIKLLDPVNVLKRGYSITRHQHQAISNTGLLKKDDIIETILYQGEIISKIEKIKTMK